MSTSARIGSAFVVTTALLASCSTAPGGAEPAAPPTAGHVPAHPQEGAPGPRPVHPGAPGQPSRTAAPGDGERTPMPAHTPADVRFMQMMIHHHVQALVMAALVPERAERDDLRLLARRIDASQEDEIALMGRWLERRGEEVPAVARADIDHVGHHGHGADHAEPGMHGMLTAEELARLEAAAGPEFDRLFLELMIFHHEGAIRMVEELFQSPGAGQDGEIFDFAQHVQSDQRIEIERMRRMLGDGS
jgi:uncharacterized protein (DUF305 family)